MTDREMVIAAAEKVMGWKLSCGRGCLESGPSRPLLRVWGGGRVTGWNPLANIADAWMLLEKLDATDITIEKAGEAWHVNLPTGVASGYTDVRRAIVTACLLAVGVEV